MSLLSRVSRQSFWTQYDRILELLPELQGPGLTWWWVIFLLRVGYGEEASIPIKNHGLPDYLSSLELC